MHFWPLKFSMITTPTSRLNFLTTFGVYDTLTIDITFTNVHQKIHQITPPNRQSFFFLKRGPTIFERGIIVIYIYYYNWKAFPSESVPCQKDFQNQVKDTRLLKYTHK